ncbi:MAG: flagellar hook-basal body complex protein [Deltaproteobacteria bacterium]|jgi:flagellar hook protein FlgE|nr:flagellar hook-basal body complex protein [Deltaproteobacteria bacterium]
MMSSLYIGATGMITHSRGMQVVSDNLANLNTVGFKQNMALYQDLFSSTVYTRSNYVTNISQLGHGSNLADVRTIFTEGSLESSNTTTDLAIMDGNGFFGVLKDGEMFYTRSGNLRFDAEGRLVDPSGANLVGHKILQDGSMQSSVTPIELDLREGSGITVYPSKATSAVTIISYLGGMPDNSQESANPVFALTKAWDGTRNPPLLTGEAGYSDSVSVFDLAGESQELNIYYDYVGNLNGTDVYEYVVGIDPQLDASARADSKGAGLLLSGTLTFSSTGELVGMTAYTPDGINPADLNSWTPASLDGGLPVIPVNFSGVGAQNITLNFGLKLAAGYDAQLSSPTLGETNPQLFYAATAGAQKESYSTASYGQSPASRYQHQDGFGQGYLRELSITEDGYITASYTNGHTSDLYRISLFRFTSRDGLRHEGDNHFSATLQSGPAEEGLPGTENFGGILSNNLETSNVDMAREFTQMIITQRGFQMNSKVITTSDAMLQKALELKR